MLRQKCRIPKAITIEPRIHRASYDGATLRIFWIDEPACLERQISEYAGRGFCRQVHDGKSTQQWLKPNPRHINGVSYPISFPIFLEFSEASKSVKKKV